MSDESLARRVVDLVSDWGGLFQGAGRSLRENVLSFEDDDDIVSALGWQLQRAAFNPQVVEPLLEAMAGRWSAVSSAVRRLDRDEPARQTSPPSSGSPRGTDFWAPLRGRLR